MKKGMHILAASGEQVWACWKQIQWEEFKEWSAENPRR